MLAQEVLPTLHSCRVQDNQLRRIVTRLSKKQTPFTTLTLDRCSLPSIRTMITPSQGFRLKRSAGTK